MAITTLTPIKATVAAPARINFTGDEFVLELKLFVRARDNPLSNGYTRFRLRLGEPHGSALVSTAARQLLDAVGARTTDLLDGLEVRIRCEEDDLHYGPDAIGHATEERWFDQREFSRDATLKTKAERYFSDGVARERDIHLTLLSLSVRTGVELAQFRVDPCPATGVRSIDVILQGTQQQLHLFDQLLAVLRREWGTPLGVPTGITVRRAKSDG